MSLKFITHEDLHSFLASLRQDVDFIKKSLGNIPFDPPPEPPIDAQEAADFINLENIQTIYRMVREDRIPYHKQGARLFFYKSELNDWIKSDRKA